MSKRSELIDFLRGVAILAMILIHVTVFFPSDFIATALWNWSQFAVPVFLFCSSYLFIQKNMAQGINILTYFKKRILRLVIPYYVFLLFFIPLKYYFSPETITSIYLLKSFLVIGGVDVSWLVLLFIMLAVLFPFFSWVFRKKRSFFWGFFVLSLASSLLFFFWEPPISYKWIMWLPWSLMFYFAFWYSKNASHKKYLVGAFVVLLIIVSSSYIGDIILVKSLLLKENKYPPNIMYLSFGMASILVLSFFSKFITRISPIHKSIHFFSIYSYDIFFIHYFVLTAFVAYLPQLQWSWWVLFSVVLFATVVLQMILIQLRLVFRRNHD